MFVTLKTATKEITVLAASVTLPLTGAWHASLELDADDPADLAGLATLALTGEETTRALSGVLLHGGIFAGKATARMIAGRGGLGAQLPAKYFKDTTIRVIAQDTLAAAGEVLAPESALEDFTNSYAREATTCSLALLQFARAFSKDFFLKDDGSFFFGERPREEYAGEFEIIDEDASRQSKELALLEPDLSPGHEINGEMVDRLEYLFSADSARAFVRVTS